MPGQADGRRKVDRVEAAKDRRIEAAGCFEGRGCDLQEGDRVEHCACLHGTVRGGAANCAQQLRPREIAGHRDAFRGGQPRAQCRCLGLGDDELHERRGVEVEGHD